MRRLMPVILTLSLMFIMLAAFTPQASALCPGACGGVAECDMWACKTFKTACLDASPSLNRLTAGIDYMGEDYECGAKLGWMIYQCWTPQGRCGGTQAMPDEDC